MAKVMVSIPDDLLSTLDAEVARRGTSRSALLQQAARQEIEKGGGMSEAKRLEILAAMDEFAARWDGPTDSVALVREARRDLR